MPASDAAPSAAAALTLSSGSWMKGPPPFTRTQACTRACTHPSRAGLRSAQPPTAAREQTFRDPRFGQFPDVAPIPAQRAKGCDIVMPQPPKLAGLLLHCARGRLQAGHWRRIPLTSERLRFRGIDTHGQVERPFWRWKPVGLLVGAGTFVLEIEVERSVSVVLEWHPTADGKPIESVGDLKTFRVIECDRPKGVCGRRVALVEMQRVFVCTIERLAGLVD